MKFSKVRLGLRLILVLVKGLAYRLVDFWYSSIDASSILVVCSGMAKSLPPLFWSCSAFIGSGLLLGFDSSLFNIVILDSAGWLK